VRPNEWLRAQGSTPNRRSGTLAGTHLSPPAASIMFGASSVALIEIMRAPECRRGSMAAHAERLIHG
jgi:hypothetical protein